MGSTEKAPSGTWLSRAEARSYLRVGRTKFWTMEKSGILPPGRRIAPRQVLWAREDLDEWVKSRPLATLPPKPDKQGKEGGAV